ncbi:hypothetical protein H9Q69_013686 [Fusarium xylarioides]|uniref:Uncharacterized protein n=1 Tax=Fusarium xylarioides TaxID=221167 RepID=A0A9P7IE70_9HYPO|nr:hypothetical protein H9Q70_011744 [Fusarium xylarioides]KAG5770622.1 hypothetical protein H9Q73_013118 [Fusarium xylarioides]KAG5770853.1 hypothetical protein H9Q72_002416 [Fusarium xylarioides]KAG5787240.1 hypothetical protein H9Q69_013686 [Fusarium xylarioides]KAG5801266.1 hypothetical protein H9Q71_014154 [Fusarium xylarioides]
MSRLEDFKNRKEIDDEISTTKTSIELVTQLKEDENSEATDQYWLKLGAWCMVTSDSEEYDDTQKAMAQQQCHEYDDNEQRALNGKERLEVHLKGLKKKLEELRKFRDEWTGPE